MEPAPGKRGKLVLYSCVLGNLFEASWMDFPNRIVTCTSGTFLNRNNTKQERNIKHRQSTQIWGGGGEKIFISLKKYFLGLILKAVREG